MKNLKVIFFSDWKSNPYKDQLIYNLGIHGAQVEEYTWSRFFLPRIFSFWKPDIIHFHTIHPFLISRSKFTRFFKLCFFGIQIFLLNLIGTKAVWTVHELNDKLSNDSANNISDFQALILGKLLSAIFTHCESTKDEIIQTFGLQNKNKVFVVPHGNYFGCYPNEISQAEARTKLKVPENNLVFLLFGGIYKYKGVLEAIDSFKGLSDDKVSLLIAGKPEQGLKEIIEEKIKDTSNIICELSRIPDDDIQIYMNASDCVLVPYKVFTTSGIAILAMSFARVCIAPRIGFFQDMLDDSGSFLYDSNDEDGLLNAMQVAIEHKENISEMGKHNLKLAEQWDWKDIAEKTYHLYEYCLNN